MKESPVFEGMTMLLFQQHAKSHDVDLPKLIACYLQ